jgi:hypothetical protein
VGAAPGVPVAKQIIPTSSFYGVRTTAVINRNDQNLYYDSGSFPSCGGTSAGSSDGLVGGSNAEALVRETMVNWAVQGPQAAARQR